MHIPFCESLCYYCACNKIITKKHERGAAYLRYLAREVELYTALLGRDQPVTPAAPGRRHADLPSDDELRELMAHAAAAASRWRPAASTRSRSIRARSTRGGSSTLAALGFNRISFGVQDFDPDVQKAVHRIQPAEQVVRR